MEKRHYLESADAVFQDVGSSPEGLTGEEAKKRLEENGPNRLEGKPPVPVWKRFFGQMKDPMILILLAAALVSGVTSAYSGESFADVIIILLVVFLNAALGVFQESKAEKDIEALQKMTAATSKVLRGSRPMTVKSEELAVGDVVLLEAGDAVPADGRIIESASLKIEEAALTGESVPVNKTMELLMLDGGAADVPLGDRKNMVYMGSTVVYGRGAAVITATGMQTEMGKIAKVLDTTAESQTPLQRKLAQLGKLLSWMVLGICAFIFGFSVLRSGDFSGEELLSTFMVAVSLAVAAIPEGLATVVTLVLSMGVTKMSRRNAVIRRLTAVETLGCTQIICSDKTGTLTQNKMTVVEHYGGEETLLATALALCSDATVGEDGSAMGEPTEAALVNYATSLQLDKGTLEHETPRVGEAPFDSGRKMMSTVHRTDGGFVQYTKGAPDEVLKRCDSVMQGGSAVPLTEDLRAQILAANKAMADQALRVLSAAVRRHQEMPACDPENLEQHLTFVGLVGMIDPIRPEVRDAIAECKEAGIRAVMITGDHRDTAVAIARQLGILERPEQAITGAQLDQISDQQLAAEDIEKYCVYARVQPEHKVRIVRAWKAKDKIVAMTGDGVNDAPSIKTADIGVGMGITGTDVTKNVADMVLADDNFATIVSAVEEGRRIYANIRKAIQFLLSSNLSEVISIFLATVLGFTILKPVHLLWINLITDCFPALALGMEPGEKDNMRRPPRDAREGVFAGGMAADVIYQGVLVSAITLAAYFIGHYMEAGVWEIANSPDGMTMAFLTMAMCEIFHSFNLRSRKGSIFTMTHQNLYLWGAGILSLVLTTAVIYIPFLSNAFGFEHISLAEYAVALGLAFTIIPIVELVKLIGRAAHRSGNK